MTSGYILIVAILVLGGVIATLGDRIGTKVGKARLSLFNLRPRKTAVLVTVITGSLISATTLGILFATSGSLRDGIFELDSIKKRLRIAKSEIQTINQQKSQVESELAKARTQQEQAQKRLDATNQNFQKAQTQLKSISQQATVLRSEVNALLAERQALFKQQNQLRERVVQLRELVSQRDEELAQKNQEIVESEYRLNQLKQLYREELQAREIRFKEREKQLQTEIAESEDRLKQLQQQYREELQTRESRYKEREQQLQAEITENEARLKQLKQQYQQASTENEVRLKELEQQYQKALSQRETRLKELALELTQREKELAEKNKQSAYLQQEVETLEQYYQNYQALRQGNVALVRGQVLAFGVVRIVDPKAAPQAVDQLLREANRKVVEITRQTQRNSDEPLVQIPQSQVEPLINQIKDGKDYVVRILCAGNYVEGEKQVQVFADAVPNQVVFQAGELLATISTDTSTMTNEEIRQRLDQLLAAAQFRARRAGILGSIQVGDGRIITVINFIEQLEKYNQPVDVKVIAQEPSSTSGPLKMQLIAIQNGQVVFKT